MLGDYIPADFDPGLCRPARRGRRVLPVRADGRDLPLFAPSEEARTLSRPWSTACRSAPWLPIATARSPTSTRNMASSPAALRDGVPVGVPRLFAGQPEASEAIYRLSRAARDGRPASEDIRLIGGLGGGAGRQQQAGLVPRRGAGAARGRGRGQAAGAVDGRGHHPRPRAAGQCLPRAAAGHRLSRPRAGRLLLGRSAGAGAVSQLDARRLARATTSPSSRRARCGSPTSCAATARAC